MIGIDVSKDTLAVTWMEASSRHVRWEETVPNTPTGIQALLRRIPADEPVVLEPTGRYSLDIAKQARAAAHVVLLAQPKKAKAFLASVQSRAKTDRLDSRGLALYGLCASLDPYPLKSEAVEQVEQLLAARKALSQALMRLTQQQATLPAAAAVLEPARTALHAQIAAVDQQIRTQTADTTQFPAVSELDRVPGIGPVTAAAVAACLQAKAFAHPDAFVAYIGLDIRVRESGKRKGQGTLTKQGNAELRRLLYLCAQASLRTKGSPFQAQYERERAKGLSTTAALCAVARKMARLCWSLAKHGTTYDPERVYTQPTENAQRSDQPEPPSHEHESDS